MNYVEATRRAVIDISEVRRVFVATIVMELQYRASGPLRSICDRWSGLLVVIHPFREAEPWVHRLLPDRVAGRRKGRRVERTYCNPADRWVAVSFPIKRGAAIRAEMKSNPITAVGVALVNLPLTVEPDPLFRITRTEMETDAGAALARLAVAQINSIRFTRGNYSKRAAVALPDPFRRLLPTWLAAFSPILWAAVEPLSSRMACLSSDQERPLVEMKPRKVTLTLEHQVTTLMNRWSAPTPIR